MTAHTSYCLKSAISVELVKSKDQLYVRAEIQIQYIIKRRKNLTRQRERGERERVRERESVKDKEMNAETEFISYIFYFLCILRTLPNSR